MMESILSGTETGWPDLVSNDNFPGVIILGIAGIPSLFFLIRWMVKFQREFTDFYIQENQKLRERVDSLEEEVQGKDETILGLRLELGQLQHTVSSHELTIARLNEIIDRRKLRE